MWTNAMVNLCRTMAEESYSASKIAAALGTKTRNAVIGKLHREGIQLKNQPRKAMATYNRKQPKYSLMLNRANKIVNIKYAELAPQKIDVTREEGFKFQELNSCQCRWPFGDNDFYFCGRTKLPDSSYCPEHEHLSKWHPK